MAEILVVAVIIAVLALLAFPAYQGIVEKTRRAECVAQMKKIYFALDTLVKDQGYWPQVPDFGDDYSEEKEWEWYYNTLQDYGVGKDHWLCPVEAKLLEDAPRTEDQEDPEYRGSYIITEFDKHHMTPYRWNQPWIIERSTFHKEGMLMIMPDGSLTNAPKTSSILSD